MPSHGLPGEHVYVLISSFCKGVGHVGARPNHTTSFYLNHLFKGPISTYSYILWYLGKGVL